MNPKIRPIKTECEWQAGTALLPGHVTGEGEPYRLELIAWIAPDGRVIHFDLAKAGEALNDLPRSYVSARHAALKQGFPKPTGIVSADPAVTSKLLRSLPKLPMRNAPTPLLDEAVAALSAHMSQSAEEHATFLDAGIGAPETASFFKAAMGLYRSTPWKIVPTDHDPVAVTIDSLGVRDLLLVVMGQAGQSFGLLAFRDLSDFLAFLDLASGGAPTSEGVPPHGALEFVHGSALPKSMRKEIARHGWPVANAKAHPKLTVRDSDLLERFPSRLEQRIAEAVSLAMPELLRDEESLWQALKGGPPLNRTIPVEGFDGSLEVTFRAPYQRPIRTLFEQWLELERLGKVVSPARENLDREFLLHFGASSETDNLLETGIIDGLIRAAARDFQATLASLSPDELRELLFEIIPGEAPLAPEEAKPAIAEVHALYVFLKRHGLPQADACLKVLGRGAAKRFETALSNLHGFGNEKRRMLNELAQRLMQSGAPNVDGPSPRKPRGPRK